MNTVKANQRLLKLVGIAFGVAAVIGGTIGIGILRTPGPVAALIPDPLWYLLVVAGSIALLAGFVISAPGTSLAAVLIITASYPVYRWLRRTRPATAVVAVGEPPG
jgi:APA family basic amino acid/polyamine antiporter